MTFSVQQIKFEILAYIKEFGGKFSDWYIGISDDPLKTMTEIHHVDKKEDIWLYKQALSFSACQTLQRYFLETLETDGLMVSEGDENTDCVYLYKKSQRTQP